MNRQTSLADVGITELLLCTNGSDGGQSALALGLQLAQALRLPVTVLGVIEAEPLRGVITDAMETTVAALRAAGVHAEGSLLDGDAQQIIPAEANRRTALVVAGAMDHPRWRRLLRGPTMRHLLDAVQGPMLCVYHAAVPDAIDHLLICSGGLPHADAAVEIGGHLALALHARVTLLHVATPHANLPAHFQDLPTEPERYLQSDTIFAEQLRGSLAVLAGLGVEAEFKLRSGDPLLEILQEIHEGSYGLVVAGSHAAVVGPARLVGDITNRIVEGAKVPVLVAGSFHAQQ